jgi:hypothetical protein
MALIAVFIAAEKLLPWRRAAATFVSLALLVLGLAVALVPERVPGLMTADAAMHKMSMPRGSMSTASTSASPTQLRSVSTVPTPNLAATASIAAHSEL